MKNITIKEFRHLSSGERELRYQDLSSHDKLLARMDDYQPSSKPTETTEEFLRHPPQGWECLTEEILREMFPDTDK